MAIGGSPNRQRIAIVHPMATAIVRGYASEGFVIAQMGCRRNL